MPEILYRKWRPRSFSELAGQEHVATTLTNALASGRIAHAYLFSGPRGTGKTSCGRLLGKALNCTDRQSGEPCNRCESCHAFNSGQALYDFFELDAASNRGIDEIRAIRDKVALESPGQHKVYLIDEVHMLTEAAFNALLKTLEEPPPFVVFILATTEVQKVPATVLSRCQRFDFRRAPLPSLIGNLERICAGESITCEPAALELIARSATGSHRDAVNLLDQLATSYGNDLTVEHVRTGLGLIGDERAPRLARLAIAGELAGGLELIASVRDDGLDLRQFQRELVAELRTLLMVKSGLAAAQSGANEDRRGDLEGDVANIPTSRLLVALRSFGEADLKTDPNSTLPLDIALAECVLGSGDGQSDNRTIGQSAPASVATTRAPAPSEARSAVPAPRTSTTPQERQPPAILHPEPVAGRGAPSLTPRSDSTSTPRTAPDKGLAASETSPRVEARSPATSSTPSGIGEPPTSFPLDPESPANGHSAVAADLGAARSQMRAIYEAARARSVPLGALINGACDIIDANDASVVFGFKFAFHAEKAATKPNLDALTDIVSTLMKRAVSVRCVHDAKVDDWKAREPVSRSALVRAAQEMGARVISPGPEPRPEPAEGLRPEPAEGEQA